MKEKFERSISKCKTISLLAEQRQVMDQLLNNSNLIANSSMSTGNSGNATDSVSPPTTSGPGKEAAPERNDPLSPMKFPQKQPTTTSSSTTSLTILTLLSPTKTVGSQPSVSEKEAGIATNNDNNVSNSNDAKSSDQSSNCPSAQKPSSPNATSNNNTSSKPSNTGSRPALAQQSNSTARVNINDLEVMDGNEMESLFDEQNNGES
jgi:hypothetical protein